MEDPGISLPEVISLSSCEALKYITDPVTIGRLLSTNRELRNSVLECVQRLVVPPDKGVTSDFILDLPNVRRVDGPIILTDITHLNLLSTHLRGSFDLVFSSGDPSDEIFLTLISLFLVRTTLYPRVLTSIEFFHRHLRYQEGYLLIDWKSDPPIPRFLLQKLLTFSSPVTRLDIYLGAPSNQEEMSEFQELNVDITIFILEREISEIGISDSNILRLLSLATDGNPPVDTIHFPRPDRRDIIGTGGQWVWSRPVQIPRLVLTPIGGGLELVLFRYFPRLKSVGVIVRATPIRVSSRTSEAVRSLVGQAAPISDLTTQETAFLNYLTGLIHGVAPETGVIPYQGYIRG